MVSEEIDIDKTNASIESMLCNYWYFKDFGFNLNYMFVINVMMF